MVPSESELPEESALTARATVPFCGDTVRTALGGTRTGITVTVALADFVVSATLVALTVPMAFAATVGAVNKPVLETVPIVADQVTDMFVAFETFAVNC